MGAVGCGRREKTAGEKRGGRVRGIGEWWVRGKGKIAKKWEMGGVGDVGRGG